MAFASACATVVVLASCTRQIMVSTKAPTAPSIASSGAWRPELTYEKQMSSDAVYDLSTRAQATWQTLAMVTFDLAQIGPKSKSRRRRIARRSVRPSPSPLTGNQEGSAWERYPDQ